MKNLSAEIVDRIFSFLVSDQETLIACSKDSALSSLVERHLYHHIIVNIGNGKTDFTAAFEPNRLSEFVSENPRILNHVRTLQIHVNFNNNPRLQTQYMQLLDAFAKTMLKFPMLDCIMLTTPKAQMWYWSDVFRTALEDRLNLPTIKEVHLPAGKYFPISLLEICKGIEHLSLSGFFLPEGEASCSTLPRLKSLTLLTYLISDPVMDWLKLHIKELQSLKCGTLTMERLPELFGVCSGTLNRLEVDIVESLYFTKHDFRRNETFTNAFPELSLVPLDLQQLYISAAIFLDHYEDHMPKTCRTWLPSAAEAIKSFISSTRHLILDIDIVLSGVFSSLAQIDFSPLAVLGAASQSIPRIDLYVHTDILPSALTRAQILSSLLDYEDVMRSIKDGVLIIHWEESAPDLM